MPLKNCHPILFFLTLLLTYSLSSAPLGDSGPRVIDQQNQVARVWSWTNAPTPYYHYTHKTFEGDIYQEVMNHADSKSMCGKGLYFALNPLSSKDYGTYLLCLNISLKHHQDFGLYPCPHNDSSTWGSIPNKSAHITFSPLNLKGMYPEEIEILFQKISMLRYEEFESQKDQLVAYKSLEYFQRRGFLDQLKDAPHYREGDLIRVKGKNPDQPLLSYTNHFLLKIYKYFKKNNSLNNFHRDNLGIYGFIETEEDNAVSPSMLTLILTTETKKKVRLPLSKIDYPQSKKSLYHFIGKPIFEDVVQMEIDNN